MFYCITDGSYLSSAREPEPTQAAVDPQKTLTAIHSSNTLAPQALARSRFPYVTVLFCVGAIAVLAVSGYIAYDSTTRMPSAASPTPTPYQTESAAPAYTPTPKPTRKPRPTPASEPTSYPIANPSSLRSVSPVVPEYIELTSTQYKWFPFSTSPNGGRVVGDFAARGGMANDMTVTVLAEEELASYRANYPYKSYFDSGKVRGGKIDVSLPAGSYFIIFRNPSPWTSRNIRAPISLELY